MRPFFVAIRTGSRALSFGGACSVDMCACPSCASLPQLDETPILSAYVNTVNVGRQFLRAVRDDARRVVRRGETARLKKISAQKI
jgi:hypothetical protein